MNSIKTIVVVGVLATVGYGLYQGLNNGFEFQEPPPPPGDAWNQQPGAFAPPSVDIEGQQTIPSTPGTMPPIAGMPAAGQTPTNPAYAGPHGTPMPTTVDPMSGLPPSPGVHAHGSHTTGTQPDGSGPRYGNPVGAGLSGGGSGTPASVDPNAATVTPPGAGLPPVPGAESLGGITPPPGYAPPAGDAAAPSVGDRYADRTPDYRGGSPETTSDSNVALPSNPPDAVADSDISPSSPTATQPAGGNAAFAAAMTSANEQLQRGQLATALLTLSIWYEHPKLSDAEHQRLVNLLDQVSGTVIYSKKHLLEPPYQVRAGDTLTDIASRYKVPEGLLAKINGITDPNALPSNKELKVVRGPFNAVVDTDNHTLTLFLGGRYAGRFPVHTGPEFENIVGQFVVTSKNRQHSQHGGKPWIELGYGYDAAAGGASASSPRVGLAGMDSPAEAEQGAVPGRIGISAAGADDLFDILSQGSKVTIRR